MACSQATQEALWLRHLNSDMGYPDTTIKQFGKMCNADYIKYKLSDFVNPNEKPSTIFCDNQGAVAMSQNPVHTKRQKHVHLRHRFCREHTEKGNVEFTFIPSKENWADIFTKGLPKATHDYIAGKMIYSLVDGKLCDYKGKPVAGKCQEVNRIRISTPQIDRYFPRIPVEVSNLQDDEEVFKKLLEARSREDKILSREKPDARRRRTQIAVAGLSEEVKVKIGEILRKIEKKLLEKIKIQNKEKEIRELKTSAKRWLDKLLRRSAAVGAR